MFNFNNLYLVLFYYLSVAILYYMKHNPIFFYDKYKYMMNKVTEIIKKIESAIFLKNN